MSATPTVLPTLRDAYDWLRRDASSVTLRALEGATQEAVGGGDVFTAAQLSEPFAGDSSLSFDRFSSWWTESRSPLRTILHSAFWHQWRMRLSAADREQHREILSQALARERSADAAWRSDDKHVRVSVIAGKTHNEDGTPLRHFNPASRIQLAVVPSCEANFLDVAQSAGFKLKHGTNRAEGFGEQDVNASASADYSSRQESSAAEVGAGDLLPREWGAVIRVRCAISETSDDPSFPIQEQFDELVGAATAAAAEFSAQDDAPAKIAVSRVTTPEGKPALELALLLRRDIFAQEQLTEDSEGLADVLENLVSFARRDLEGMQVFRHLLFNLDFGIASNDASAKVPSLAQALTIENASSVVAQDSVIRATFAAAFPVTAVHDLIDYLFLQRNVRSGSMSRGRLAPQFILSAVMHALEDASLDVKLRSPAEAIDVLQTSWKQHADTARRKEDRSSKDTPTNQDLMDALSRWFPLTSTAQGVFAQALSSRKAANNEMLQNWIAPIISSCAPVRVITQRTAAALINEDGLPAFIDRQCVVASFETGRAYAVFVGMPPSDLCLDVTPFDASNVVVIAEPGDAALSKELFDDLEPKFSVPQFDVRRCFVLFHEKHRAAFEAAFGGEHARVLLPVTAFTQDKLHSVLTPGSDDDNKDGDLDLVPMLLEKVQGCVSTINSVEFTMRAVDVRLKLQDVLSPTALLPSRYHVAYHNLKRQILEKR